MQSSAGDKVFFLELNLKRNKQEIQKEISNFFCTVDKSSLVKPTIKKGMTASQQASMVEDDYKFIFADFTSKVIKKWIRKVSKFLDLRQSSLQMPPKIEKQPKSA